MVDQFILTMMFVCMGILLVVTFIQNWRIHKLETKQEELIERLDATVEIRKSFEHTIAEIQRKQSNLLNMLNMGVVGKHAKKEEK